MYIYMCTYIRCYMYTHIYVYVPYMYTHIYVYVPYMYIGLYMYIELRIYTHVCTLHLLVD
jgi:hypothetical protein